MTEWKAGKVKQFPIKGKLSQIFHKWGITLVNTANQVLFRVLYDGVISIQLQTRQGMHCPHEHAPFLMCFPYCCPKFFLLSLHFYTDFWFIFTVNTNRHTNTPPFWRILFNYSSKSWRPTLAILTESLGLRQFCCLFVIISI